MQVRQRREVDLNEFGTDGRIVLEPLTFSRKNDWKNNIGKATHYTTDGKDVKIESHDLGDLMNYKIIAYITDAPFKLNSLPAFMAFMDRLDAKELGTADRLVARLNREIDAMKEDDSPLQASQGAETSSSE